LSLSDIIIVTMASRRAHPSDLCASTYTLLLCHLWSALLACGIINTQTTPRCTLQPRRTTSR